MPEAPPAPAPSLDPHRHALKRALGEQWGNLRIVAEGVLGAESRIDWVTLTPGGELLLVLAGQAGQDLELVARALAQQAWVEARLPDWIQLAPQLGLRREAGVAALLLCPAFGPEAQAAAGAAGRGRITLATFHFAPDSQGLRAFVIPLERSMSRAAVAIASEPLPVFRTGLSDADLGISPEEESAFEPFAPRGTDGRSTRTEIF